MAQSIGVPELIDFDNDRVISVTALIVHGWHRWTSVSMAYHRPCGRTGASRDLLNRV
jgi:hypothetical protein